MIHFDRLRPCLHLVAYPDKKLWGKRSSLFILSVVDEENRFYNFDTLGLPMSFELAPTKEREREREKKSLKNFDSEKNMALLWPVLLNFLRSLFISQSNKLQCLTLPVTLA